eukprot:3976203-Prorocentrum_lima.AAC.1
MRPATWLDGDDEKMGMKLRDVLEQDIPEGHLEEPSSLCSLISSQKDISIELNLRQGNTTSRGS